MIRMFEPDVEWCADAVAAQVRSGNIGPGKTVAEFEALLAQTVGRKHAICTTSGTVALMLSLLALDMPRSARVVFPDYGMLAGANAARMIGRRVELQDVDDDAIIEVGFECWHNCLMAIAHNGRAVPPHVGIEDACQALGIPGAGTVGRLSCFSFSPQKIVTTGQGGAVVTDDDALAERVRQLIDHGGDWRATRTFQRIGGNFRMSDLAASLGFPQLMRLPVLVARRMEVRAWYRERFPEISPDDGWLVMFPSRDAEGLVAWLIEGGIAAAQLYPPVHWSTPYKTDRQFPGAEAFHRKYVYLPSHLKLDKCQVGIICDSIEEFEHVHAARARGPVAQMAG